LKAAILGYGKSGKSAEIILKLKGFTNIDVFDDFIDEFKNISEFKNDYDLVSITPGIKLPNEFYMFDNITSEIDLAYSLIQDKKIIVVTGTNGKSTVTDLTAQILNNLGLKAVACGNIGKTFTEAVLENNADIFVLELSSFQIELLKDFNADSACITNIAPDHLDRYSCYEEYVNAKYRICKFLKPSAKLIYDKGNEYADLINRYKIETIEIDTDLNSFPILHDSVLDFKNFYADISNFNLFGKHNLVNLAFSLLLIDNLIELKKDVTEYIKDLKSLEHRCEFVTEVNGSIIINDSKGTNVDSTYAALKSSKNPVILILGGKDKNGDFSKLIDLINEKVEILILFASSVKKIYEQIAEKVVCKIIEVETLEEVIEQVKQLISPGKTVLFSPACASFDQFENFEKRGKVFKKLVLEGLN
jgi:UDP-N-acetylmuramoylalanine--D-glutamate ligase